MRDPHRIFLVEQTPEALEAVRSGDAIISSGGIRRKDGSMLEQSRPVEMSVADLLCAFESDEKALVVRERLKDFDKRFSLSEEAIGELEKSAWLNFHAIQQSYVLTFRGFQQTLLGIDRLSDQLSGLEEYIRKKDIQDTYDAAKTHFRHLRTAASNLRAPDIDVTNISIAAELDEISTFLERQFATADQKDCSGYVSMQILTNLMQPFVYVVKKYSALYFYRNGFFPGNYGVWIEVVSRIVKSICFRNLIEYYVHLHCPIPFRDRVQISAAKSKSLRKALESAAFEKNYISKHTKEEYLGLEKQIAGKLETGDTITYNGDMIIFV